MTVGSALRCLLELRWLNVCNGCCRVGLRRAVRTFACIAACVLELEVCASKCQILVFDELVPVYLNLKCVLESAKYWCPMQYEVVCNLTLMCYFAVQTNNTLQWR